MSLYSVYGLRLNEAGYVWQFRFQKCAFLQVSRGKNLLQT